MATKRNEVPTASALPASQSPTATQCTLVLGRTAAARETAIAAALQDDESTAVLLEGLPDGQTRLPGGDTIAGLAIVRIAPGCICCSGNLPMRVHLNRVLRKKPQRMFMGIASADHLAEIRRFLSASPYDKLLHLTKDVHA